MSCQINDVVCKAFAVLRSLDGGVVETEWDTKAKEGYGKAQERADHAARMR